MLLSLDASAAFLQVVMIDLVLAGDNAVVIGLAAAGLPDTQRVRAVLLGIFAAILLRIAFAVGTTQLLQIAGLALAGGMLLLWVSWKMWRELRTPHATPVAEALAGIGPNAHGTISDGRSRKTMRQAVGQIVVADVSMSLDNILAVAGAARDHISVLVIGLVISIALTGLGATLIAQVMQRHRWVAYLGLTMIVYVALEMIHRGSRELMPVLRASFA